MKKFIKSLIATAGAVTLSLSLMPQTAVFAYEDGGNTYEWKTEEGKQYWYENGERQGIYGSKGNVFYDETERGREIYDRESDGWYWLDAVYSGAKAENKEVFMPYIYSDEEGRLSDEAWIDTVAALSNKTAEKVKEDGGEVVDLSAQVKQAIKSHGGDGAGKWVRYDAKGKMVKGWYKVQGSDEKLYPKQAGNVYYYDRQTGLMAKGTVKIDGVEYVFDGVSGALTSGNAPDIKSTDSNDSDTSDTTDTDSTDTDTTDTETTDTDETEEESGSKDKMTESANAMVPGKLYAIGDETVINSLKLCGDRAGTTKYNYEREYSTENIRCIFELNEWIGVYINTGAKSFTVWAIAHDEETVYDQKTGFSSDMKGYAASCDLSYPEEDADEDGELDCWGDFYLHPDEVEPGYYDLVFTCDGKAVAKMLARFYAEEELYGKSDEQLDNMILK